MGLRNIRRRAYPHDSGHFLQTATASCTTKAHRYSACVAALFARHFPRVSRFACNLRHASALRNKQYVTLCGRTRSAHPPHPLSFGVQGLAHYAVRDAIDRRNNLISIKCKKTTIFTIHSFFLQTL